jgi:hypothetical protein
VHVTGNGVLKLDGGGTLVVDGAAADAGFEVVLRNQ